MINKRKIVRPRTLRGSGQQINKIKMKSTLMPNERERDKDSDFFFSKIALMWALGASMHQPSLLVMTSLVASCPWVVWGRRGGGKSRQEFTWNPNNVRCCLSLFVCSY